MKLAAFDIGGTALKMGVMTCAGTLHVPRHRYAEYIGKALDDVTEEDHFNQQYRSHRGDCVGREHVRI